MRAQGMGGDIVYICSKNSVFAGPDNVAYGAAKADQAHQVRLLAAELGEAGIRVNGINPDGVVRGSGIFAGGWGAQRAAVYGVRRGGARRVLRAAHPAEAGGAARARGRRGVRADRRRPAPDHRAAHPGGRRGRGGVPALRTVRRSAQAAVAAVDLGASSGRVMVGRVGAGRAGAARGAPVPRTCRSPWRARCTGTSCGCTGECWTACARRPARFDLASVGIDSWGVDYGLLGRDRGAARQPGALPGRPHRRGGRAGAGPDPRGRAVRDHRGAAAAVQHDLPARRGGGHAAAGARPGPCC